MHSGQIAMVDCHGRSSRVEPHSLHFTQSEEKSRALRWSLGDKRCLPIYVVCVIKMTHTTMAYIFLLETVRSSSLLQSKVNGYN